MSKFLNSAATTLTLALGASSAFADVPFPECVNNPACNQGGGGCSVSTLPADAAVGAGAVVLAAAALLAARRKRAR